MPTSTEAFPLVRAVSAAFDSAKHEYDTSRRLETFLNALHKSGYAVAALPRPLHELFEEEEGRIEGEAV